MVELPIEPVPIVDYGPDERAMARYREAGTERALELGNRGPIRFDARFLIADGARARGSLGGSGELLDLRWFAISDALQLTIADVTEFMLGEVARAAGRAARRPRPLFRYRKGQAYAVYS